MQDTTSSPRLRILQISPRIPWPVSDGSAIGIYNITRSVAARGHHITFVAFAPQVDPREQREDVVGDMPDFCELETVVHDTRNTPWKVLRNLFSPLPYPVSKYEAPEMYAQLDALCTERHFDVLHVDHAHMACYGEYVRKRYGIPYVLREHNFETTIYRRYVEQAQFLPARMYFNMQSSRLYRFEATALRHPDVIAAITPEDARAIHDALASVSGQTEQDEIPSRQEGVNPGVGRETRSTAEMKGKNRLTGMDAPAEEAARPLEGNRARVRVIPAGVDIERHRPFDEGCDDAHVVLVGSLAWAPNSDAAQWFVTSIWPHISAAVPEARCTIAGVHPPKSLLRHQSERLRIPGFVDDYTALLASATVMAVPLRIGSGMRIKLLEFFAHGKAVVSTGVGAEGNAAQTDAEYLRADSAEDFAAAVIALFNDERARRRLGEAARTLVERHYAWEHIGEQFEMAYTDAIRDYRRSATDAQFRGAATT